MQEIDNPSIKNQVGGKIMPQFLLGILAVVFLSFIVWNGVVQKDINTSKGQTGRTTTVSIGHKLIKAYIADTMELQEKGLGGRESIASDQAMLFVFGIPAPYGFWMKDMRFPIDIFWLDPSKHVIFIKEDALPSSYPEIFIPDSPAEYVLETPAGFVGENNLKIGTEISF